MNRTWLVALGFALCACGVTRPEYDAKVREAETAKQQAETAKKELAELQQQVAGDNQQITDLKNAVGMAQSRAITDEQKAQLEEAKRAVQDAQERGRLLEDLKGKFKRMIDAGHLKVTTRHGRAVLQLHNDVLFDRGDADVKPAGKQAIVEVAATLRGVGGRRFQVAGHTDSEPMTAATKKRYPSNWELSTARAIAVVKLLVESGVAPGEMSAAGYGPYDPIASNASAEGQAKNRRIEITLVPYVALPLALGADKN
jgi:chemotaxis protein MotB